MRPHLLPSFGETTTKILESVFTAHDPHGSREL